MSNKIEKVWQDKEWLRKQYFDNGLSFMKIGKLCGKSSKNIEHWFKKFGFKSRQYGGGENNPRWKGGRVFDSRGYVRIFHPDPHAYKSQKYVLEHILVMESVLDRPLCKPEIVHHKNGIPGDNRPSNLMLFANNGEHKSFEQNLEKFAKILLFGDNPRVKDIQPKLLRWFDIPLSYFVNER